MTMTGKTFFSAATKKRAMGLVSNLFVYSIGICIILGKQIGFWNIGLDDGVWSYFLATAIVGVCFIFLTFSFSEMVSMLPFTGGCYGYVRCSLGPGWGYLVGCCEATKYIIFQAIMVQQVAKVVYTSLDISSDWAPMVWLATMCLIVPVQVFGQKMFWAVTFLLALAVMTVFLLYLLEAGAAKGTKHMHIASFEQRPAHFIEHLPLAVVFYAGIDAMRTCTDTQSNHTVPKDMVVLICTAAVLALSLIATASCLTADGVALSEMEFPLSEGFAEVMGVPQRDVDWLSLPGAFAGSFAFTYAIGRQLRSMAGSGLLPAFLNTAHSEQKVGVGSEGSQRAAEADGADKPKRHGSFLGSLKGSLKAVDKAIKQNVPKKPVAALLFGSIVSYGLLLLGHFCIAEFELRYLRVCVLLATAVYSSLMAAYFVFILRYSNLDRAFRSPFGLFGAGVSMLVFLIIFISASFLQPADDWYSLALFVFLCIAYTLYYVCVAKKRQFFSKEEQEKFMKVYVVNSNTARKKTKKSSSRGGNSSGLLSGVFAMLPGWLQSSRMLSGNNSNHKDVSKIRSVGKSVASIEKASATSLGRTVVPSLANSDGHNGSVHTANAMDPQHLHASGAVLSEGDLAALQSHVLGEDDEQIRHVESV